jgi:hypothetical protein
VPSIAASARRRRFAGIEIDHGEPPLTAEPVAEYDEMIVGEALRHHYPIIKSTRESIKSAPEAQK